LDRRRHRGLAGGCEIEEERDARDDDRGNDHPSEELRSGQLYPIVVTHDAAPEWETFLLSYPEKVNLIGERFLL
jgi:hypothetical protein